MKSKLEEIEQKVLAQLSVLANSIALELVKNVQNVISDNGKVNTGNLRKSISHDITKQAEVILVKVFSNSSYSAYVHDGTRPHWPPIERIALWVEKKGLATTYTAKGNKRRAPKTKYLAHLNMQTGTIVGEHEGMYSKEVKQLAFLIARKISRVGTQGLKFFELGLKMSEPFINEEIAKFKAA